MSLRVTNPTHIRWLATPEVHAYLREHSYDLDDVLALIIEPDKTRVVTRKEAW